MKYTASLLGIIKEINNVDEAIKSNLIKQINIWYIFVTKNDIHEYHHFIL